MRFSRVSDVVIADHIIASPPTGRGSTSEGRHAADGPVRHPFGPNVLERFRVRTE